MTDASYQAMDFDGISILTVEGEKNWTYLEFVQELKEEAGNSLVQILTTETATTIHKGSAVIVLTGQKEVRFWNTMDTDGWPSGMHPRVVRRSNKWGSGQ